MSDAQQSESRRDFLKTSTAATVAAAASLGSVHAGGSGEVRVGLVGCGGRGKGAAQNALQADPNVRIVALADLFDYGEKGVHKAKEEIEARGYKIDNEYIFVGFDAYKKILQLDLDYVILATPPYFRPEHIMAAVQAGKNIFTEKPAAVDPPGARLVMEAAMLAKKKGLSIAAGTQRRHQEPYLETYKRILHGSIGEITSAQCYWCGGQLWRRERDDSKYPYLKGCKDMELMIRNWVNWSWLSGDHIVEQHVHNLDVVNWFLSKDGTAVHPEKAAGFGGRARRVTGDQFDFFSIDYTYPGDVHVASYCRQVSGCKNNISEEIVGEHGRTFTNQAGQCRIDGPFEWRWPREGRGLKKFTNPYVQEHIDLIDSIRNGKGLNEAHNVATTTLTAIMGRISAYTGKEVTWDEMMKSNLKVGPKDVNMDVALLPEVVPVPGNV